MKDKNTNKTEKQKIKDQRRSEALRANLKKRKQQQEEREKIAKNAENNS